ncbi:nucleoside phosphorylase domain-containing protein [Aspergillus pseudonomiae]|nr:nucleoside phosphorylase domain-containing protein [Aspergillus pseudonomiae]
MSDPDQYTVGWICTQVTEYVAARAFLDRKHSRTERLSLNDNNHYTLGEIGGHQVVIAVLPDGEYGVSTAAWDWQGIPTRQDIRLGDVVVSSCHGGHAGLIQYDFGKELQGQDFLQTGRLNQPPLILRTAVAGLQAQYEEEGHQIEDNIRIVIEHNTRLRRKYARPPPESDRLYKSHFHPTDNPDIGARLCDGSNLIVRQGRTEEEEDNPAIRYGLIASGNRAIKDALFRDRLAAEQDVLCFKMEAAGLINHFPGLVICGICDYADSHTSTEWQGYAAMMAAAYTKDLLYQIVPQRVKSERRAI